MAPAHENRRFHNLGARPSQVLEILVLNNEFILADSLSRDLGKLGHIAEAICHSDEAERIINERRIDHVVCDWCLRGETSERLIREVLIPKGIKYTVTSNQPGWNSADAWKKLGFQPHVVEFSDGAAKIIRSIEMRHNVARR